MKLVLHNYWRSSASYRVRIALAFKGLVYEYVPVNLLKHVQFGDAYRAKNTMAQVPTLEIAEDDGSVLALTQSLPIIEYLDERWHSPSLLPADRVLRAKARALAEIINAGIQPLQNLSVLGQIKELGADDKKWACGHIEKGLAALDVAARQTAGMFLVGNEPTVADVCLVPQLYASRRFGVDLAAWPRMLEIEERCQQLDAFLAAAPDRQPDAVKA